MWWTGSRTGRSVWVDIMSSVGEDMSLVIKELHPKGEVQVGLANR